MPADTTGLSSFGQSSSISADGNLIVVGTSGATVGLNESQGAAYVYERFGYQWSMTQQLIPSGLHPYAFLGWSVSVSADASTILVGSPGLHQDGVSGVGGAFVLTNTSAGWEVETILRVGILEPWWNAG